MASPASVTPPLAPTPVHEKADEVTIIEEADAESSGRKRDLRFWLIIVSILVSTFLSALDMSSIATALPTIAEALKSQDFTWVGNAYSITSTAFIPWAGGMANIFGRRPILLVGLLFFATGSAMCGAAKTMSTMLAGRALQGVGSGAILSLVDIILADIVPLSERGVFQGAFSAVWALASAAGPLIGGALAGSNWRWLFYMNLPLTAIVAIIVTACMELKVPEGTMREKMRRMDWVGNCVFIPSITLFIIGLVWGGQQYSWSSVHVLVFLILGAIGLVAWYFVEKYYCEYPTVPFEMLMNRTTVIGYFTTFIHGISWLALSYYWPVYFQAVKGHSPVKTAVDLFSVTFIVAPFAMIAGGSISATQVYKPHNIIAWVLMTLGPGLMYLITATSPEQAWVPLPIPFAIGIGLLFAATLFPVLAPLPPSLAGQALAFLVFVRSFGNILGITIGSAVLTNELGKTLPQAFLSQIPGGVAGAYSSIPYVNSLPEPLRTEVQKAFASSIRVIWLVLIPFGGIGLIACLGMEALRLETVTDEQWGITDRKKKKNVEGGV